MRYAKLRSIRALYGLKQKDMGEVINVSKEVYNRRELGKSKFTIDECEAITNYFNEKHNGNYTVMDIFLP